jgi:hypothetical protein
MNGVNGSERFETVIIGGGRQASPSAITWPGGGGRS